MNKFIKIILIILLFIFTVYFIFKLFNINDIIQKQAYPKKYEEYVSKYAKEYNIDELLIYSIIKAESNFNEKANSNVNAIGLMQIMESTANEISIKIDMKEINKEQLYNPEINIKFGCYYLSTLIKKYDNIGLALAAYNAGMGRVDEWIEKNIIKIDGSNLENIPFKETNMYVRKVLNNYKIYKRN